MSTGKHNHFWTRLNLLVGMDWKNNKTEDIEDWLDGVEARKNAFISENSTFRSCSTASEKTSSTLKEIKSRILELQTVDCSFSHPKIRSRLEKLMGSNVVRLTDRNYMLQLHDRILEDYIQSMNKRIAERAEKEREREKELVLTGQIPFEQAPEEMASHPVLIIHKYCAELIAERRAKIKLPRVYIPFDLYVDDTPGPLDDIPPVDHIFHPKDDRPMRPSMHLDLSDEEDNGIMMPPEDFDQKLKYESPMVKELAGVETVEEMYELADEIIGPLRTITDVPAPVPQDEYE